MLDYIVKKVISRKLLVFGLATAALFFDKINGGEWITISSVYLGFQAVQDTVTNMISKRLSSAAD